MKKKHLIIVFWLYLCLLLPYKIEAQDLKDTVKILWIGSSSTYCHDLPLQTADWLKDYFAPVPVHAYMVGRSGTGLHDYLRPDFQAQYGLKPGQTLLEKIRDERYDFVVLQMITYFIGADLKDETENAADIICSAVKEAGGEPVYYEMGWRTGPENEIGRQSIFESAKKNNVKYYGACSTAWKKAREEHPEIELFNLPDHDHPGTLGTYLNLLCMYQAFTGKTPKLHDSINVWPPFGKFDKNAAKEKLKNSKVDYYHQAMPDWMKLISVMQKEVNVDRSKIKYLIECAQMIQQETKIKLM